MHEISWTGFSTMFLQKQTNVRVVLTLYSVKMKVKVNKLCYAWKWTWISFTMYESERERQKSKLQQSRSNALGSLWSFYWILFVLSPFSCLFYCMSHNSNSCLFCRVTRGFWLCCAFFFYSQLMINHLLPRPI